MLPLTNWTRSHAGRRPSFSRCTCDPYTNGVSCTRQGAISATSLSASPGAPLSGFGPYVRGPLSAPVTHSTHVDAASHSQLSRKPGALRPRLHRATPAPPPPPPPSQQQQQLLTIVGGDPRVGTAASRPRTPQRGEALGAARPGSGIKTPAPAADRQAQPLQQQPQLERAQQNRVAVGGGTPLQSRSMGFAMRTGLALTWLGTNSGTPTLERNVSCTLVRLPGAVQMVDCGEGTHRQLLALKGSMDLAEVDGIFITHLHGDHCFGLPAALAVLDQAKAEGQADPSRRRHHVYGPPGLAELVRVSMFSTGLALRLQLPLLVSELICTPATAHPPQPLAQALGQRRRLQQHQQPYGGGRGRGAPGAGVNTTDASELFVSGGTGGREVDGGGFDVPILLQRIAAQRVQDATELTSAVDAVQSRVAALEEIWSPPPPMPQPPLRYQPPGQYGRSGGSSGGGGSYSGSDVELLSSSTDEDADESAAAAAGGGASFRRAFVAAEGYFWELPGCAGVRVRAAQLQHRVPCWGYVFTEARPYEEGTQRRKVVVLGDTVSSRPIAPLAAGCDVMAHEATFAHGMEAKARVAQHSTGWMAGAFAAAVGARNLVLTHFSARYRESPKDLDQGRSSRFTGQQELEQQSWAVTGLLREAVATYGRPDHLFAASDFFTFHVPRRGPSGAAAPAAAAATEATCGEAAAEGEAAAAAAAAGQVARARLLRRRAAIAGR